MRTTFERIQRKGTKRVNCVTCGKRIVRSHTFEMTLNPWNTDPASGLPRTREQIWDALTAKVAEWQDVDDWCSEHRP